MKLLVFAHTPPPHHGQSYMVKLLVDGFGGDARNRHRRDTPICCYHVNAQFSADMEDIGSIRSGKLFLLFKYCAEAIWCRFRHGVSSFYYVPAPGKRSALYRDWLVMALCRPFFKTVICHWHAVGLGNWLRDHGTPWERTISQWLLGRAEVGIALAVSGMSDALWFRSKQVALVPNGIPDPCPDFEETLLPVRLARLSKRDPQSKFRVLYMAHCTREKGLFDTLEAVRMLHEQMPGTIELTVAGSFLSTEEKAEFDQLLTRCAGYVNYAGFVSGTQKDRLLREHDCFCFPSYYCAESFGLVLCEAMAYGMPIVTSNWRALPEMAPAGCMNLAPIQSPSAIVQALTAAMGQRHFTQLRRHFLEHYTVASHLRQLSEALEGTIVSHVEHEAA